MNYNEFLATKQKTIIQSGFDVNQDQLNYNLFPFQRFIVHRALKAGKYAIFADCGLGKTPMELVFAQNVLMHTNRPVLVLALPALLHKLP